MSHLTVRSSPGSGLSLEALECSRARSIELIYIPDLLDVAPYVQITDCRLGARHSQNAGMASRLRASLSSFRRAGNMTMSTSRESAAASRSFRRSTYAANRKPVGAAPGARSTARSMSDARVSSPRATEPNTETWRTPSARSSGSRAFKVRRTSLLCASSETPIRTLYHQCPSPVSKTTSYQQVMRNSRRGIEERKLREIACRPTASA